MKNFFRAVAVGAAITLAGCQSVSTTSSGTIGVQRQQQMVTMLSESEVNQMAAEAYRKALAKGKKDGTLNQNHKQLKQLRAIADRLVKQVGVFRMDALHWDWEVNLLTSQQLNAYCMPGGKIMFYTGILDELKLTDDEIAAIMGHEMAHALREHGREAMSHAYVQQLGFSAAAALLGAGRSAMQMADAVVNYGMTLPNSRTNEVEADLIGLELMARAGYDPHAAVTLWEKMSAAGGGSPPEFMSTHPAHNTRISGLRASIPKVRHLGGKD
ncbi:M48 family metalloprotease [Endozoicomonas gorgoniicola]|uniref:M48 family metalloprotease n=1 Tax=Endozoicomonas gorgoniicola TaxID=1234144 RepID=A0ABT3MZ93_9GAMM|nr:M48 family metalloprotease [Endozoicomonas gorgoniicola]MCW7554702.1 M48 family metalloprotease [Endozoicomonas gorgoniicola]